ncbi:helix-turn-helix domain-containing protein [Pseudomonas songnenensis]|uniref:Helix-turn-helix domain-containing protein n=1 Tax=Pseudomonas songnenensis TaxID=1176259 RepID=A0ABX9UTH0_9PSED|nr:helix-turn-helix domain-containing protein [Pseudomonas songnenensis]MCQ4299212.1 helix-turn-helix domain-containing protein [Pseudomonas songnenensis]RMH96205.1 helix-turn-helix domain-containing protein [Pseudomonas songnenensis]
MSKRIPNYALYGQAALPAWQDLLHLEWISDRGDMHHREIRPHQHDSLLQVVYVRSGEGEVSLENSRMAFHAPCLILLPQRTVHAFRYSGETDGPVITAAQRPLESMARILSGDLLALMQRPTVIPLPWNTDGTEPIWPLIQMIQSEAQGQERGNVAAGHALLIALLVKITRLEQPAVPVRPANSRRSTLLGQFRDLVDQKFKQHWPLTLYAEALGVTPATLGRACREELGESPTAVINERIVREAQRQLAYTALDIQQIAHELGYGDAAYFSRFFRKQAGIKPSEFRAAFRGAK